MKSPTAEMNELIIAKYKEMRNILRVDGESKIATFNESHRKDVYDATRWLNILKNVEFSTLTVEQRGDTFHPVLTWCSDSDIISEELI